MNASRVRHASVLGLMLSACTTTLGAESQVDASAPPVDSGFDSSVEGYPRSDVTPQSSTGVNRLAWNRLYRIVGAFMYPADAVFPTDGEYGIGILISGFQLHGDDTTSPFS